MRQLLRRALLIYAVALAIAGVQGATPARAATHQLTTLSLKIADAVPLGPRQRIPLRAHLASPAGEPLANALIVFFVEGRRDGQARTDAAGNASWRISRRLNAGSYALEARFAGGGHTRPSQATLTLNIAATAIRLEVPPAELGAPLEARVALSQPNDTPLAGGLIRIFVDGRRVATGRSGADGTLSLPIRADLVAGSHSVEAVFVGQPRSLPARARASVEVRPGQLEIETVPRLAGVRFALDGVVFTSDQYGIARLKVERPGQYTLRALPWDRDFSGVRARFARWMDDNFSPERRVSLPAPRRLQAGFATSYLVQSSFIDLHGRRLDPHTASSIRVSSNTRVSYTLSASTPRWLPGMRVVRLPKGLEARPIAYTASSVIVDGANVVNPGQQRFEPNSGQPWPIRLSLYATRWFVRDAMFGFPIGSSLQLTYPNGMIKEHALDAEGSLALSLMARGAYSARAKAPGISATMPLVLNRDQDVEILVISYLDLAVLAGLLGSAAGGLLLIGRPELRVLLRQPGSWGGRLAGQLSAAGQPAPRPIALPRLRLPLGDPTMRIAILLMLGGIIGGVAGMRFMAPSPQAAAAPPAPAAPAPTAAVLPPRAAAPPTAAALPPASLPAPPQAAALPPTARPTAAPAATASALRAELQYAAPLGLSSEGPQVELLQQRLRELGYFMHPENTAWFGEQTQRAVREFQRDRKLPVTGVVGPQTIAAINSCDATCARP